MPLAYSRAQFPYFKTSTGWCLVEFLYHVFAIFIYKSAVTTSLTPLIKKFHLGRHYFICNPLLWDFSDSPVRLFCARFTTIKSNFVWNRAICEFLPPPVHSTLGHKCHFTRIKNLPKINFHVFYIELTIFKYSSSQSPTKPF